MVYIASWQQYQEAAEALYAKSPNTVRIASKIIAIEQHHVYVCVEIFSRLATV
jgi:hypothetical protein